MIAEALKECAKNGLAFNEVPMPPTPDKQILPTKKFECRAQEQRIFIEYKEDSFTYLGLLFIAMGLVLLGKLL